MSNIDIFRSDQLTASEAAIQLIKQKYIAGDIDFMEFTILSNNFINARKDYVELLRAFHLNEINLKYLQNEESKSTLFKPSHMNISINACSFWC